MTDVPDDLSYTAEHVWVRTLTDTTIRVCITDFAQSALGDVVFVSLPAVGASLTSGEAFAELESTKSVSEIYAPVDGLVIARNDELSVTPEVINSQPYEAGWVADIEIGDRTQLSDLLDATAYSTLSA